VKSVKQKVSPIKYCDNASSKKNSLRNTCVSFTWKTLYYLRDYVRKDY